MYGNGYSEELLGRAFADRRDKVIIASKAWPTHLSAEEIRLACEQSLKRLATDYIDVYYIHWPSRTVPFAETMEALGRLRDEGKIRVIGCSNFGVHDLPDLLKHGRVEVNELPYSLLWRAIEYEILPVCIEHKVSVTAYMPLLQGLLTGKWRTADEVPVMRARTRHFSPKRPYIRHSEDGAEEETFAAINKIREICQQAGLPMVQVALAWVIQQQGITSTIVGARSPEQVQANAAAADLKLSNDMIAALDRATEPLKQKLGTNADLWQSADSRFR